MCLIGFNHRIVIQSAASSVSAEECLKAIDNLPVARKAFEGSLVAKTDPIPAFVRNRGKQK